MSERPQFVSELGSVTRWTGGLLILSGVLSLPFGALIGPLLIFCAGENPFRPCTVVGVIAGVGLLWLGRRFLDGEPWSHVALTTVIAGILIAEAVSSSSALLSVVQSTRTNLGGTPEEHEANTRAFIVIGVAGAAFIGTLLAWLLWRLVTPETRRYFWGAHGRASRGVQPN